MWLGLPAAVSNVCGNSELIEDRVNGCGFAPQDVPAIVESIEHIVGDPQAARLYAERSREKVLGFAREPLFSRKERLFQAVSGKS